jgi:hypothetical protein
MLIDLIAAPPQDADAIVSTSGHANVWPTLELNWVDRVQLATLAFILQGKPPEAEAVSAYERSFENLVTASEDGPWIDLVPAELTQALAILSDDRIGTVAQTWAATAQARPHRREADDLATHLRELSAFAASALAQDRRLLLWVCE